MANNNSLFNAAIAGIGGAVDQRWITGQVSSDYARYQLSIIAFATAVDAAIPPGSPSTSDAELLQSICVGILGNRDLVSVIVADYNAIAASIAALYSELQPSLLPVGGGGGAVSSVFGRTGAVVAVTNDYNGDQIENLSSVSGSSVDDALDTLGQAVFPFAISTFAFNPGSENTREVGDSLTTPAFVATYSLPVTTATLTDSVPNGPQVLALPANAFSSAFSYTRSVPAQTRVFTLAATKTGYPAPSNRTLTTTWFCRVYYGNAVDPGVYNSAFINSLPTQVLRNIAQGSYTVNAGSGESSFFATLSSNALTSANFTVNGLPFAITKVGDPVSVTNAFGVVLNFQLWRSDNVSLGAFTFVVS